LEQGSGGAADIRIFKRSTGTLNTDAFLTVSEISTGGERGLLGLAFDPNYAGNGVFYIYVTNASGHTEIRRHQVTANADVANAAGDLILTFTQPFSNHNGGWMGFGLDGYLYIASGDGGSGNDPPNNGQRLDTLLGKILRIDVSSDDYPDPSRDYSIPVGPLGNPFANDGDDNTLGEIWAYGLRNPWRSSFDRATGDFYIADVGQNVIEEINVQPVGHPGGANYGWRLREGMGQTGGGVGGPKPPGAIDPIYNYFHGGGANQGNSVTGGYVYRGPIPELGGNYFFGDFENSRVWSLRWDGSDPAAHNGTNYTNFTDWTSLLAPNVGTISSISSFGEDNQGNLFIVDYGGEIFTISNGGDYLPTSGRLTFTPGDTTKTITVSILGDVLDEPNETFAVNLANATGDAVINDGQGIGTITDNDATPTINLSGPATVTETTGSTVDVFYDVELTNPRSIPIRAEVVAEALSATSPGDYQFLGPTNLTFNPGETFKRVGVRIFGDATIEPNEQFRLRLQNVQIATVGTSQLDVTITNDDNRTVSVNDAAVDEGNVTGDNRRLTFTVTLSEAIPEPVTVLVSTASGSATGGQDYVSLVNHPVTIAADETTAQFFVEVQEDGTFEPNETFVVNLSSPSNNATIGDGQGTGTVNNDDPQPTISISDASIAEGGFGSTVDLSFNVTLSNPSHETVTIIVNTADGTATLADSDYEQVSNRTLTFNPGQTSQTTTVRIVGDATIEADETFVVNLTGQTNSSLADPQGQGTITNDDVAPPITASPDSASLAEDPAAPVVIDVLANDVTVPSGGAKSVIAVTQGANGTVTFTSGNVSYQPNANFFGTDTFTYVARNTTAGPTSSTSTATVTVTVTEVNDLPTLNPIGNVLMSEDADPLPVSLSGITSGAVNELQTLSIVATSDNPNIVPNPIATYTSAETTGSITLAPLANQFGVVSITVRVFDDGDGTNVSTQTFTVTVTAVNDEPTLDQPQPMTLNEDQPQPLSLTGISAGSNETQTVSITATSDNPALLGANPLVVNYDGVGGTASLPMSLVANAHGTAVITLVLVDNGGSGGDDTHTATVAVSVRPVNDPPSFEASDDPSVTDATGAISIPNWAKTILAGPPDEIAAGQQTSFELIVDRADLFAVPPAIDNTGRLTFTPAPNVEGTAEVELTIHDTGGTDFGGVDSFTDSFSIVVTKPHRWYNARNPLDVNDSRGTIPVTALDALNIFNRLNANVGGGNIPVPPNAPIGQPFFYDVSQDHFVSALDALRVLNELNRRAASPEGEAVAVDALFAGASAGQDFGDLMSLLAADVAEEMQRRRRGISIQQVPDN
jgi:glucose/arabinose dehydrogenase